MRIVVVASGGGLGNRLNAIFTGIALHFQTNLPISVLWNATTDFDCSFYDLFEYNKSIEVISQYPFYPFVAKEVSLGEYVLVAAYYESHPQPYVDVICSESLDAQLDKIAKYKTKYAFAVHGPCMNTFGVPSSQIGNFFFNNFEPRKHIIAQVFDFLQLHKPNVSVHMRLTDKAVLNNYNTANVIKDLTNLNLPKSTTIKIFICSDDNEYEKLAITEVRNSCHVSKTESITYADPANIGSIIRAHSTCIKAMVDFLIFTFCNQKFGINSTANSSTFFSCGQFLQEEFRTFIKARLDKQVNVNLNTSKKNHMIKKTMIKTL